MEKNHWAHSSIVLDTAGGGKFISGRLNLPFCIVKLDAIQFNGIHFGFSGWIDP